MAALVVALAVVAVPASPARADRIRDLQWFWGDLDLTQAQKVSEGAGVTVAVLDTGVDRTHADLKGAVKGGQSIAEHREPGNIDPEKHGTGIAGIIAGRGHGSGGDAGVRGIAPEATIMPIDPINDTVLVARGIDWAVEHGAKVINMSFGVRPSETLHTAIRNARAAGVVLVAAAGNEADKGNDLAYPGAYPEVITVGSLDRHGKILKTSNHGEQVDIAAPGDAIPGPRPDGGYVSLTGNSASAAIVSGAAALILAKYPDLQPAQVEARLIATAIDRGTKGRDDYYGAGALNLMAALTGPQPAVLPDEQPTSAGPAAAAPYTPAPADKGLPGWLFLVAVAAVLALIIALITTVLLVARRRRTA
ncbi:serine protease [Actinoplanes sp. N902-109]|nr:serine protease [Actinoplanes sp. N902-109]